MSTLSYLVGVAETLGYEVATDDRQNRGVAIIPESFSSNRVYGNRLRITSWQCSATFIGASVGDGTCFTALEALSDGFEADQTAGATAGAVSVGEWNTQQISKGLVTFQTTVTVEE